MDRPRRTVALLTLLLTSVVASAQPKEVIGYFPSWKWNSRGGIVTPARIPYDRLTIINYAFFAPLPDGTIAGKDTTGDALYLRSSPSLTELAHNHGVKVVLSLGGWEDSDNFPAVAATPQTREVFAGSCAGAIRQYGFDGIDIDWEYPGFEMHKGSPADRQNFTALLRTLRDTLTAVGTSRGQTLLLTAAFPAATNRLASVEVDSVAKVLDLFNIMTYDFYGPWDAKANHNAPLYPSEGADSSRCMDAAFRLFHDALGIPSSRITVGVPFYGQTYTDCTALNSSHHGSDTVHFSRFGAFYYDIAPVIHQSARYWDEKARVPYLINTAWNVLISYDDEKSVAEKARYVMDHDIHGVIIWEITGDFMPDGSTPLLNSLDAVLQPAPNTVH